MSESNIRRSLRPRKEICYKATNFDDNNKETAEDLDESYRTECEEDSSSGDELFSKKPDHEKPKTLVLEVKLDEEDVHNEYRLQRQKNMRDRFNVLKTLEFDDDVENLKTLAVSSKTIKKPTSTKRLRKPPSSNLPVKRSLRLQNRSLNTTLDMDSTLDTTSSFQEASVKEEKDERILEKFKFVDTGAEEDIEFLSTLKNELHIPYEENGDYFTSDMNKLEEVIRTSKMRSEPNKIIKQRIVSLDFHPSQKKLLLLAGDKQGNIALWDLAKETGIEFKAHAYNVNCVSFSNRDQTKFYSTSLDGTLRCGDVNDSELDLIYSSESDHTTWHHEFGQSLFVAHGNGDVKLLDLRESRSKTTFDCHSRSVRTVQLHPTNENYFLTSSGTGTFGIWDVRNTKSHDSEAVILQNFDKALTSAFFSAKGNFVLTTGNDDTIRTFDCRDLKNSIQSCKINHNNHGGRWLSVFKARWLPQREDYFIVGSMMNNPKRMQVYQSNGDMIHQFVSENMEINYEYHITEVFESGDESYETDSEEDINSSDESFNKKERRKQQCFDSSPSIFQPEHDEEEELNEYRLQRQKNMQDRFNVLKTLNFDDDMQILKIATKRTSKLGNSIKNVKSTTKRTSKKRKVRPRKIEFSPSVFQRELDEEDNFNEYRLQRLTFMQDRLNILKVMLSDNDVEDLKTTLVPPEITTKPTPKNRRVKPSSSSLPVKRSLRLQNRPLNTVLTSGLRMERSSWLPTRPFHIALPVVNIADPTSSFQEASEINEF